MTNLASEEKVLTILEAQIVPDLVGFFVCSKNDFTNSKTFCFPSGKRKIPYLLGCFQPKHIKVELFLTS